MARNSWIYILTNHRKGTLYIGVTRDLAQRMFLHRHGCTEGFTQQYGCKRLVYAEPFDTIIEAMAREKQLKNWKRSWKIELIEKSNPNWDDLYYDVVD